MESPCPHCGRSDVRADLARLLAMAQRLRAENAPLTHDEVVAALLEIKARA